MTGSPGLLQGAERRPPLHLQRARQRHAALRPAAAGDRSHPHRRRARAAHPHPRRAFAERKEDYYGPARASRSSASQHKGARSRRRSSLEPIPAAEIVVADLSDWHYQPRKGQVAVDPELGRIVFPPRHVPKHGIRVRYHYGFSADLGGGEYDRPLSQPAADAARCYHEVGRRRPAASREGRAEAHPRRAATAGARTSPVHAVDRDHRQPGLRGADRTSGSTKDQTLQLRAARRARPVIRLLDWQTSEPDSLTVHGRGGRAPSPSTAC